MWYGYLSTTNLNLTNPQHAALIAAVSALGPATDPQPANLNHRGTLPGGDVTIFEALFDEATIAVAAWTDRLGDVLEVDPGDISTDTVTRHYSRDETSVVTYTEGGVEYLQVALFGDVGSAWATSGDEARAYVAGAVFVAADDATANEKSRADYLCDGVADQVQINAALAAARSVELSSGTFLLAGTSTVSEYKALAGQSGWATVLNGDFTARILVLQEGAHLRNIDASSAGAVNPCTGIELGIASTVEAVFIRDQLYGFAASSENVALTDVHFDNIRAPNTWAACVHCTTGTNGVTIDGFYANDCDRGIEVENGARNVTARNGTLTDVDQFPLDVHTHTGLGITRNVLYENFVLNRCGIVGSSGTAVPKVDRCENVTYRNIQQIDPAGLYGIVCISTDGALFDTVVVSGIDPADEYYEQTATDVTIVNCSWL